MAKRGDAPALWLVDAFNVLHTTLLGGRDRTEWWTEPRRAELAARAADFDDEDAEVWLVFDGPRPAEESAGRGPGVRWVFAPSADEWLLERLRSSDAPERIAVVTSDRKLAARARRRGARLVAPADFLARCRSD
jgi:hypothetical protein